MSTTTAPVSTSPPDATTAVANLIRFLETGEIVDNLFAPDVFADVSLPQWRLQSNTREGLVAIRNGGHPFPGEVRVSRVEPTERGFTMEFEERWEADGQHWYCREMVRADVDDATIVDFAVYCTGDWDPAQQAEHAAAVTLLRP